MMGSTLAVSVKPMVLFFFFNQKLREMLNQAVFLMDSPNGKPIHQVNYTLITNSLADLGVRRG